MVTEADKRRAEDLKTEGNRLFARGKFDAAAEKYTESLTLWPDWTVPLVNRATCHKKKGNWAKVEEDCRAAISLNSTLMKAHYFLGQALEMQEAYAESIRHLTKALESARESEDQIKDEIWRELARVKYNQWEQQSAERKAEQMWLRERFSDLVMAKHKEELEDPVDYVNTVAKHKEEWAAIDRLFDLASAKDRLSEPSNTFTCRLTMEIFRDPVATPSGISYERSALMDHLNKLGNFDPVTRQPVSASQLVQNLGLRAATQEYLDDRPWAWKDCM
ncbi:hypothetical protein BSKO_02197 [Bryopsis sp. KO-2023]|nr:hypothetical protein BSKO_02197 [Bryopsis sp. KO-2023]